MKFLRIAVWLAHVCCLVTVESAMRRKTITKKQKTINWSTEFYKTKFDPCRELRQPNAVEAVRAHAFATGLFRRCGPRIITDYATRYNVPAFALHKAMNVICYGLTVAFAHSSNNGLTTLSPGTPSSDVLQIIDDFIKMLVKLNRTHVARLGADRFTFTTDFSYDFFTVLSRCVFNKPIIAEMDLDSYKHTLHHTKVILL